MSFVGSGEVARCAVSEIDLRLGDWRKVLADVESVDAVITDPPYGERTHAGHNLSAAGHKGVGNDGSCRTALQYKYWKEEDVFEFVSVFSQRCSGWFVAMTSHDLAPAWQMAYRKEGLYSFAPLPFVSPGSRVRLSGDGPSGWTAWIMVARPRSLSRWGTLPGWYDGPSRDLEVVGGKPLWLMRAIIRDYTRPGDMIVDPFAGGGTTLIAAAMEGRSAIGAEIDPKTYDLAQKRIRRGWTPSLFARQSTPKQEQGSLL